MELWVMDAGSTDGTVEILRSYDGDARFHWVSEPDKGQSDAINKGLARCTGEIFNWINSDDYLEPGALRRVAEEFEKDPALDIVSGWTAEFRGEPAEIFNRIQLQVRASAEESIPVGVFCQPSTFWRTEILRAQGGVDTSLHYVMDWNMWVRYLARHGQARVRRIEDLLAHFRHHAAAKTSAASGKFYDEARVVFHNLHLSIDAPEAFLFPEVEKKEGWQRRDFEIGPGFDRTRYLGAFADRMVRTYRRREPKLAKEWLGRAWGYGFSWWRVKMGMRLMWR